MNIILKNESGQTKEASFIDMDEAAIWCMEYPEYGITLYPENGEESWNDGEWQEVLDFHA